MADARRKLLSEETFSDHLMLVNAFDGWEDAREHGRQAENDFCWRNFMAATTLKVNISPPTTPTPPNCLYGVDPVFRKDF